MKRRTNKELIDENLKLHVDVFELRKKIEILEERIRAYERVSVGGMASSLVISAERISAAAGQIAETSLHLVQEAGHRR
jgi:hypothetical protein